MYGGFGVFLNVKPRAAEGLFSSLHLFKEKIIPFSVDGGGNFLCFDYTEVNIPKIVLWHHEVEEELNYFYISETFEAFIKLLYVPADVLEDLSEQDVLPEDIKWLKQIKNTWN